MGGARHAVLVILFNVEKILSIPRSTKGSARTHKKIMSIPRFTEYTGTHKVKLSYSLLFFELYKTLFLSQVTPVHSSAF